VVDSLLRSYGIRTRQVLAHVVFIAPSSKSHCIVCVIVINLNPSVQLIFGHTNYQYGKIIILSNENQNLKDIQGLTACAQAKNAKIVFEL